MHQIVNNDIYLKFLFKMLKVESSAEVKQSCQYSYVLK